MKHPLRFERIAVAICCLPFLYCLVAVAVRAHYDPDAVVAVRPLVAFFLLALVSVIWGSVRSVKKGPLVEQWQDAKTNKRERHETERRRERKRRETERRRNNQDATWRALSPEAKQAIREQLHAAKEPATQSRTLREPSSILILELSGMLSRMTLRDTLAYLMSQGKLSSKQLPELTWILNKMRAHDPYQIAAAIGHAVVNPPTPTNESPEERKSTIQQVARALADEYGIRESHIWAIVKDDATQSHKGRADD